MNNIFEAYAAFKKIFHKDILFLNKTNNDLLGSKHSPTRKMVNWSNLLFKDLIYLKLEDKNREIDEINSLKYISKKFFFFYYSRFASIFKHRMPEKYNRFSFFYDLSQKVLFYKLIKNLNLNKKKKILLPEVGLVGFPLIILKKMGFKYIFAYDQDNLIRYSIKKVWGINTIFIKNFYNFSRIKNNSLKNHSHKEAKIALSVINSSKIDLNYFLRNKFFIVLTNWHSTLLQFKINNLKNNYQSQIFLYQYNANNIRSDINTLTKEDYQNFTKEVLN
jgi:hypothetical protein